MVKVLIALLLAPAVWGAACVSTRSGNWSDTSVWTSCGGGKPGDADTASIANGHTVTVDEDTTVGTSVRAHLSYIHSFAITQGAGYTSCSASASVGTPIFVDQQLSCNVAGGVISVTFNNATRWYTAASAAPTVALTGNGSGAGVAVVWAQGSGVSAVSTNTSGVLAIGAGRKLTARGTLGYAGRSTPSLVFGAGAKLEFDSSQAADIPGCTYAPGSPACKPVYSHGMVSGAIAQGGIYADCPTSSRCTITSNTSGNIGTISAHGYTIGGALTLKNVDVSRLGDSRWEMYVDTDGNGEAGSTLNLQGSTFTNCGRIKTYGRANRTISIDGNVWANTAASAVLDILYFGGTNSVTRNVFDVEAMPEGLNADFLRMEDNYFAKGTPFNSETYVSFDRNFFRVTTVPSSQSFRPAGDTRDNYLFFDGDPYNWHVMTPARKSAMTISGNITGVGGAPNPADSGEWIAGIAGGLSSPTTFTIANNIVLPSATGYAWCELAINNTPNAVLAANHNTWFGGFPGGAFGMVMENENVAHATGRISSLASNIAWNPNRMGYTPHGDFYVVHSMMNTGLNADVDTPSGSDYNWKWNHTDTLPGCTGCTNQGRGYASKYSVTPGAHDQTGDPQFTDYERAVELYDSKFLGNAPAAWESGQTYSLGDFVSAADAAVYWGNPVNYRCRQATCVGTLKPGVPGTAWRADGWEWASLYRLREDVAAGATYELTGALAAAKPPTCSASAATGICRMMAWVRAGYVPTNPALRNAGHDGLDIGAVPFQAPSGTVVRKSMKSMFAIVVGQ